MFTLYTYPASIEMLSTADNADDWKYYNFCALNREVELQQWNFQVIILFAANNLPKCIQII